jgi:RHH-type proline utilization regulon transcriptional repressor/proline dehydrogenase/delta 1-pyrroline-5-carboxylate dehydrogenase
MAQPWVEAVRRNPPPFWALESLLKEYPLSSAEGLALMRLAEALLRVPDTETAIALTADQLGRADFANAQGPLARLSGAAISLSKKLLPDGAHETGMFAKLGARTVVAAALRAVQLLGHQFVLGQDIGEAMGRADAARNRQRQPLTFSYDMLGEGARRQADALDYLSNYQFAIKTIATHAHPERACEQNDGISIKLSALHPRYEEAQRHRVLTELVPRVRALCESAAQANMGLTVDAEESDRLELSLDVFEAVAAQVARRYPGWQGFGMALQAYQTRALPLVEHVAALGRKLRMRFMCRLVKGAYWDGEIKRAQEMGLPCYPVFTRKHHTDTSYLACARALLDADDVIYPQFATHNAGTIAAILQMAQGAGRRFELQRLHGMGEGIFREIPADIPVRVYAPVGRHRYLLAYLVRRLLENGANSSFVHQLADEATPVQALLASPIALSHQSLHGASTGPSLPLPAALYGPGRQNSAGLDLAVESMRAPLLAAYHALAQADVAATGVTQVPVAVRRSAAAFATWGTTPVEHRAAILRQAGDRMQAQLPQLCALLVKEAFKTWGDAVSEVREAVDYLRYYADEAERIMQPAVLPGLHAGGALGVTGESNVLRLRPRGPWVCISPWNFPLAIFTGQVAAALATGNTVLAKPAEQTPRIALEAVRLLHQCGIPAGVLQLLNGRGDSIGAALVEQPGVAGVVFTGSTAVAKTIQRALAAKDGPIVPLIAETGGINVMLVDSTALPEQVTDAVMQSAFRSAGQRCSALRLLCVHDGIADAVIAMVQGAASELVTGDPSLLATDLGPVIDREAYEAIHRHLSRLRATTTTCHAAAVLPQQMQQTNLVAPHAFEVERIADVQQEIFGPVLHIVRWSGDAQAVIDEINALGYGLTLGLQTRIDSRAQALATYARAGNVYVNRSMIGAVVGVQPFGGEGLSGTGPKAGGPHYLARFCSEQTITVNTTAAGGNAALLSDPQQGL